MCIYIYIYIYMSQPRDCLDAITDELMEIETMSGDTTIDVVLRTKCYYRYYYYYYYYYYY